MCGLLGGAWHNKITANSLMVLIILSDFFLFFFLTFGENSGPSPHLLNQSARQWGLGICILDMCSRLFVIKPKID